MRAFLCAISIFLLLLILILTVSHRLMTLTEQLTAAVELLPPCGDGQVTEALDFCEALWERARPFADLAVSLTHAERIDCLMASLRASAAVNNGTDYELHRILLLQALEELRLLMSCRPMQIL